MGNKEKNLLKKAVEYYQHFSASHSDLFIFHDNRFMSDCLAATREFAKGEDIDKEDYELGMIALILSSIGVENAADKNIDNASLVNTFLENNTIDEDDLAEIRNYITFFNAKNPAKNNIEKVLRDGKYSHLGYADSLERQSLLRLELEKLHQKNFTELEWLENCKDYYIRHGFETSTANRKYGSARNRNYLELEKRIDKLKAELQKENGTDVLSGKEGDDLFKIAFRNYLNLVDLADKKAGLLIQVNTILASVVGAFGVKILSTNPVYAIPTAAVLVGSAMTIFYAILASKPLERKYLTENESGKEQFFFGSFDRLDPEFRHVTWDKYLNDMTQFFKGNKVVIFDIMIKESFEVRKVLSKKFIYLSIAYKIFFAALVIGILGYLSVLAYDLNFLVD